MSNGTSLVDKIQLTQKQIIDAASLTTTNVLLDNNKIARLEWEGRYEKIIKFTLENLVGNVQLAVVLTETHIRLALIKFTDNQISTVFKYEHRFDSANYPTIQTTENATCQGYFRPIDYKLNFSQTNLVDVTIVFENSIIDCLRFRIKSEQNRLDRILNESEKKSYFRLNDIKSKTDLFKSTRQVIFSANRCIMFHVAEFSRSILVEKQPPTFQINVFKITAADTTAESSKFGDFQAYLGKNASIWQHSDYLWYFKQMLYLNNSRLMSSVYDELYRKLNDFKPDTFQSLEGISLLFIHL